MSAVGRAALAAALAATAACSFTTGFDGFVGSGPGAADGGGGTGDRTPTTVVDPASPADEPSTTDGGVAVEAAAPDPNVPPVFVDGGTFCSDQTGLVLCDDFDTAQVTEQWIREGSFVKLTSHASRSAPNNFLLDAPRSSAAGTFVSKITHPFQQPSTNLLVAFDFLPERTDESSAFLILAAVEYTKAAAKYSLRLVYVNGEVRLEESNLVPPPANVDTYHPFFTIPRDRWSRVKLDVTASGANRGVQISLDDVPVGARVSIDPTAAMDPTPTLILGAVFGRAAHTGWTFRYDNVTVAFR